MLLSPASIIQLQQQQAEVGHTETDSNSSSVRTKGAGWGGDTRARAHTDAHKHVGWTGITEEPGRNYSPCWRCEIWGTDNLGDVEVWKMNEQHPGLPQQTPLQCP